MADYRLSERTLPLHEGYDVIVTGGGPAGCAAAVSAARAGKRTLLIEQSDMLGGAGTRCLVNTWTPMTDRVRVIYAGIAYEVFRLALGRTPYVDPRRIDWVPVDAEALKSVYDDLTQEAGVDVLFGTRLCAAEREGGRVTALICANQAGLGAWRAPVYIDCTGDAVLCALAGAPTELGDAHGQVQPATHCFVLANVNEAACRAAPGFMKNGPDSALRRILANGRYPIPDAHMVKTFFAPGMMSFNAGHLWQVDPTDPVSMSRAQREGRRLARTYLQALKAYLPEAFGEAVLAQTASSVGVREGRRIVGEYVFTLSDFLARRTFPDEIARGNYFVDVHYSREELSHSGARHSDDRFEHYGPGESYGVPYRCLIPKTLDNVLCAGRIVSCDHMVLGSLRVMPECLCMGQAAGAAAAQMIARSLDDARDVDTAALRHALRAAGAYLPEEEQA